MSGCWLRGSSMSRKETNKVDKSWKKFLLECVLQAPREDEMETKGWSYLILFLFLWDKSSNGGG